MPYFSQQFRSRGNILRRRPIPKETHNVRLIQGVNLRFPTFAKQFRARGLK